MTPWLAVSLVALSAWLVLALAGYRQRRVPWRKTLIIVAIWVAIFGLAATLFSGFQS